MSSESPHPKTSYLPSLQIKRHLAIIFPQGAMQPFRNNVTCYTEALYVPISIFLYEIYSYY